MEEALTQTPDEMVYLSHGWSVACRTLMVIAAVFIVLFFMLLPGIGIGCGRYENVTDFYFGPFNWLIITQFSMLGKPDATLVVINPRGFAWAVSAVCAGVALFQLMWWGTRWRPTPSLGVDATNR